MSRNPACSFRKEESWWRARGADSQHKGLGHACATWREEEECVEGKRALGRGSRLHSHLPSALCWQVPNPLADLKEIGKRGRILKGNS